MVTKKLAAVLINFNVSKYQFSRNTLGLGMTQAMLVHPQQMLAFCDVYLISSLHLCRTTISGHISLLWVFWNEV